MSPLALAALLCLAQAEEAPPAEAPPPAAEGSEPAPPAAQPGAVVTPRAPPPATKGADEAARYLQKYSTIPEHERGHEQTTMKLRFGKVEFNPVLPPDDLDFDMWVKAPEAEQGKLLAHRFLRELCSGDAAGALRLSGFPFQLEERRVDRPEDLKADWSVRLRKKRTDLWTIYDVEVLSPAEMEKKYGKPPSRLASWSWRAPKTQVAVANVSGHAVVLLLRQVGATWQIVGFHD